MKKLIFLAQEYLDVNRETLSKKELDIAQSKLFAKSVTAFKEQMKELYAAKVFQIVKELTPEAVLIEYAPAVDDQMWEALRAADIVSIVDSIIPNDI